MASFNDALMPDLYRKRKINHYTTRTDIKTSSFAVSLVFEGTLDIMTIPSCILALRSPLSAIFITI